MPFSQNSRSALAYVTETVFGTTPVVVGPPAGATLIALPFSTSSLEMTKGIITGGDIQPDEMERWVIHGNRTVSGDIVADFRKGDFDPFLESVMRSTWAANVLKVGTIPKYFSIEEQSADISQYRIFTGCTASKMSMSVTATADQPIVTTFGMVGKQVTIGATTIDAAGGNTPYSTNQPMTHHTGSFLVGNVGVAGVSVPITSIDFSIDRAYEPAFAVGGPTAAELIAGRSMIEGTFNAYFQDATLVNRFLNETLTRIVLEVDDVTNASPYTFDFPSVKINSSTAAISGATGPRMITCSFRALYNVAQNSNLVITRTV